MTPHIGHRVMPAFLSRVRTASLHCLWDARLVREVVMLCVPACVRGVVCGLGVGCACCVWGRWCMMWPPAVCVVGGRVVGCGVWCLG